MRLSEKLCYWAMNEEMIDIHYKEHGKDCMDAAWELDRLAEDKAALITSIKVALDQCREREDKHACVYELEYALERMGEKYE